MWGFIGDDLWGEHVLRKQESPMRQLTRWGTPKVLGRVVCFLLQAFGQVLKLWQPSEELVDSFGLGMETAPRYALLWHRTEWIPEKVQERILSIRRNLWLRAVREMEPYSEATAAFKAEDLADMYLEERMRLQRWMLDTLKPKFDSGEWTPIFVDEQFPLEEWPHCKELRILIFLCFMAAILSVLCFLAK